MPNPDRETGAVTIGGALRRLGRAGVTVGEAALREPSEWCGAPARPGRRRAGHTHAGRPVPGARNAAGGRGVGRRIADGCRSGLKKAALGITKES